MNALLHFKKLQRIFCKLKFKKGIQFKEFTIFCLRWFCHWAGVKRNDEILRWKFTLKRIYFDQLPSPLRYHPVLYPIPSRSKISATQRLPTVQAPANTSFEFFVQKTLHRVSLVKYTLCILNMSQCINRMHLLKQAF